MDETPEYILMCQKATEIQEVWRPAAGDFMATTNRTEPPNVVVNYIGRTWSGMKRLAFNLDDKECFSSLMTWLPRQDQLQDMMIVDTFDTYELFCMFDGDFLEQYEVGGQVRMPKWVNGSWSLEMFWLSVIMKEKHNKVWNGQDWVSA